MNKRNFMKKPLVFYYDNKKVKEVEDVTIKSSRICEKEKDEDIEISEKEEKKIYDILHNVFNLKDFREGQRKVIESIVYKKNDCLVVFPTGGGKSLTYQLSALLFENGVSVIISPLIALMQDQIKSLQEKKISAESLNSSITLKKKEFILNDLKSDFPTIKLLYISPEQLSMDSFRLILSSLYEKKLLNLFAIDEAHCISSWGKDFRKSYSTLGVIKELYAGVPTLACTGTATEAVKIDIINTLKLHRANHVILSFDRKNLFYKVKFTDLLEKHLIDDLVDEIKKFENQCGIVYCLKKQTCEEVAEDLRIRGIQSKAYHAGLPSKTRLNIQEGWASDSFQVLVGTVAFGLGVDKGDVRFVIHYTLPKSIEEYYQESGRAGRDGKQAFCILYYSLKDYQKLEYIMKMQAKESRKVECVKSHQQLAGLKKVKEYCELLECRRSYTLKHFGQLHRASEIIKSKTNNFCCDFCFDPQSVIKNFQKYKMKSTYTYYNKNKFEGTDDTNQNYSLEFEKIEEDDSLQARPKKKSCSYFLSAKELQFAKKQKSYIHSDVRNKGLNAVLKELEKQEAEAEKKDVDTESAFFRRSRFFPPFSKNKNKNCLSKFLR